MSDLLVALAKARENFTSVVRDRENAEIERKGGSYKYASLDTVIRAVLPALEEEGLTLTQTFDSMGGGYCLVTQLIHNDTGDMLESKLPVNTTSDLFDLGRSITYLRRYSIVSMLCLDTEEDTDGAGSSGKPVVPESESKLATNVVKARKAIMDADGFDMLHRKVKAIGDNPHLFPSTEDYREVLKVARTKAMGLRDVEQKVIDGLVDAYLEPDDEE